MSREPSGRKRIERGLYLDGSTYYACATPPGTRSAVWKSLGPVGKMEARRLRDEFITPSAMTASRPIRPPGGDARSPRSRTNGSRRSKRSSTSASSPRAPSTATSWRSAGTSSRDSPPEQSAA